MFTQTWRDNAGREWTIRANVATFARVKDVGGIDLVGAVVLGQNTDALSRLLLDPVFAARVLWACVQPEAEQRGITEAVFCDTLDGESIGRGVDALLQALPYFFPTPEARTAATQITKALAQARAQMAEQLTSGGLFGNSQASSA